MRYLRIALTIMGCLVISTLFLVSCKYDKQIQEQYDSGIIIDKAHSFFRQEEYFYIYIKNNYGEILEIWVTQQEYYSHNIGEKVNYTKKAFGTYLN